MTYVTTSKVALAVNVAAARNRHIAHSKHASGWGDGKQVGPQHGRLRLVAAQRRQLDVSLDVQSETHASRPRQRGGSSGTRSIYNSRKGRQHRLRHVLVVCMCVCDCVNRQGSLQVID